MTARARRVGRRRGGQRRWPRGGARRSSSRSAVVSALDGLVPSSADGLVDDVTPGARPRASPRCSRGSARSRSPRSRPPTPRWSGRPRRRRGRSTRSCTCGRSPTRAAGPRSAAAGSSPRAGSPPTRTSSPAPTGSRVSVRGTGRERAARVVAFDPRRDVAVLEVSDLRAPASAARGGPARRRPGRPRGLPGGRRALGRCGPGARRADGAAAPTSTAGQASPARSTRCAPRCGGERPGARCSTARRRGRHGLRDLARRPGHRLRPHPRRDRAGAARGVLASSAVSTGACASG